MQRDRESVREQISKIYLCTVCTCLTVMFASQYGSIATHTISTDQKTVTTTSQAEINHRQITRVYTMVLCGPE